MSRAPGMHWPSFLRELHATEAAWQQNSVRYPRSDAVPWMPFPIPQFITLLTDAVMAAPPSQGRGSFGGSFVMDTEPYGPPKFLDVGCGPGTKIRLAEEMFGLRGYGIDIVPRFVAEAQAHGVKATVADAFEFGAEEGGAKIAGQTGYPDYQIVMVNRPSSLQDELETLIMERMAPDSVLMAVNWRNDPGKSGWILQAQEYGDPVCGVWIKP